jgi:hypothetical protein
LPSNAAGIADPMPLSPSHDRHTGNAMSTCARTYMPATRSPYRRRAEPSPAVPGAADQTRQRPARASDRAVSHRSAQGRVAVMSAAEISACRRSGPGKAAPVFTSTERLALAGFLALHHPVHHRAPRKRSLIAYDHERSARTAQRGKTGSSGCRSVLARQHEHRNLSRGPGLEFADRRSLPRPASATARRGRDRPVPLPRP